MSYSGVTRRDAMASAAALAAAGMAAPVFGENRAPTGNNGSLPWPPRGGFAGKAIVGPHQPSPAAMIDTRSMLGLGLEAGMIYGGLRDVVDGSLTEWVRRFPVGVTGGLAGLLVQTNRGRDALHISPEIGAAAASSLDGSAAVVDGVGVWRSAPGVKGKPYIVTMSADGRKVSWREDGILDVTGTLIGPGLQWHMPDAQGGGMFYVSQIYEMRGKAFGREVRGIMPFDQAYLPTGVVMYSGKDALFRPTEHHRAWYTWGTRYEDGSVDAGHFLLGTDRMGFALLTNEREELTLDTDVTGDIELDSSAIWPKRITLHTSKGVDWEFLPDPKSRMPDFLSGKQQAITPQMEGRWRRVGDTRKPATWMAWGEIASAQRIGYSEIYRR